MIRAGLLALLLTGCGDRATPDAAPVAATRAEAVAAAQAFFTARNTTLPSIVDAIDMGDRWRLAYRCAPRECGTGGITMAVVNKRSGEVVHWEAEQ